MRRRAKGFPKPIIITGKRIKGCAAFCGGTPFAFYVMQTFTRRQPSVAYPIHHQTGTTLFLHCTNLSIVWRKIGVWRGVQTSPSQYLSHFIYPDSSSSGTFSPEIPFSSIGVQPYPYCSVGATLQNTVLVHRTR